MKHLFKLLPFAAWFFAASAGATDPYGLNRTATGAGLPTGEVDLAARIGTLIGAVLSLVGVVFLALMVYGGFIWMTASGDTEKVKKAKTLITNAIIGLVIIASGYAITSFVLRSILEASGA